MQLTTSPTRMPRAGGRPRGLAKVVSVAVVATTRVVGFGSQAGALPPYPAVPADFAHAGSPHAPS